MREMLVGHTAIPHLPERSSQWPGVAFLAVETVSLRQLQPARAAASDGDGAGRGLGGVRTVATIVPGNPGK